MNVRSVSVRVVLQVEIHLHERRLAQEREHELARRQLESERTRQEQEMARRVAEMRTRDARLVTVYECTRPIVTWYFTCMFAGSVKLANVK